MIHIAAISQILETDGRAYYRRPRAAGKQPLKTIRWLKRRISDAVYRQLLEDEQRATVEDVGTDLGRHCRACQESSAVDLPLLIDTSDQPRPGPAEKTLLGHRLTTEGSAIDTVLAAPVILGQALINLT